MISHLSGPQPRDTSSSLKKDIPYLLHINIRGMRSNRNDLQVFLSEFHTLIPIICLNEHWLNTSNVSLLNSIPGFSCADSFSRAVDNHGGSAILVRNDVKYKVRGDLHVFNKEKVFEASCIELTRPKVLIISLYRIPRQEHVGEFFEILDSFLHHIGVGVRYENVFFAADFNVDLLGDSDDAKTLVDIFASYALSPNFITPTRVTSISATCIDNIFSKNDVEVSNGIVLSMGFSDHKGLFLPMSERVTPESKVRKSVKMRNFSINNFKVFRDKLSVVNWDFNESLTVNENFDCFLGKFLPIFNETFCAIPIKQNNRKGWITAGIVTSSRKKRELHKLYMETQDQNFKNYYRSYNRIFKSVIKLAKRKYHEKYLEIANNKVKAAWDIVKFELGKHKNKASIIPSRARINPSSVAEDFNSFFIDVPNRVGSTHNLLASTRNVVGNCSSRMRFKLLSPKQVEVLIKSLKNKNSAGWDEIPVKVFRMVADILSEPLSRILNQSFTVGEFPHKMKYALVRPIFKKDDKEDLNNYRPIAILTAFSKLFEKAANEQILHFMRVNNIVSKTQFGFLRGLDTEAALIKFFNTVSASLDASQQVCGVLCDLSKAFDCVNHDILVEKLRKYGIRGRELWWFNSFLKERMQATLINHDNKNYQSKWAVINAGVPQGSILGPTLFIIYVNDLSSCSTKPLIQYADDTSSIITNSSLRAVVTQTQEELLNIKKWFAANGLSMNSSKTKFITFQPPHFASRNFNELADLSVPQQSVAVDLLGVTLDSRLDWSVHTQKICSRVNSAIFSLRVLKNTLSFKALMVVYYGYLFPFLKYGITLWGRSKFFIQVFRSQKKALRVIFGKPPRYPCRELFLSSRILTLPSLYILEICSYVHKNLPNFTRNNEIHSYNTRHSASLSVAAHRTAMFEKSPQYMGPKIYNRLPQDIRDMADLRRFRGMLKRLLLERPYYSVDEFLQE